MAATTKIYYNGGDEPIVLPMIDTELQPGEQVSVTSAYHQPIIIENFPGLKEVTDLSEEEQAQHNEEVLAAEASQSAEESTDE